MLPFGLPPDVWRLVLSSFSLAEVVRLSRVSRAWTALAALRFTVIVIPHNLASIPNYVPPRYANVTRCEAETCGRLGSLSYSGFCAECYGAAVVQLDDRQTLDRHRAAWQVKDENAQRQRAKDVRFRNPSVCVCVGANQ